MCNVFFSIWVSSAQIWSLPQQAIMMSLSKVLNENKHFRLVSRTKMLIFIPRTRSINASTDRGVNILYFSVLKICKLIVMNVREREKKWQRRNNNFVPLFLASKKSWKPCRFLCLFLFYGCRPVDEAFPVINHTQTIIHAQIFTFINIYCLSHREGHL
jgi:hypothetical protein